MLEYQRIIMRSGERIAPARIRCIVFAALALWASACLAQHDHGAAPGESVAWASRHRGLPMVTSAHSAEAQHWFDQGLLLTYGFNHEAAIAAFNRASTIEPSFAMAYWGIALALSSNINSPVTPQRALRARAAVERASSLLGEVSQRERAYIEAMRLRYIGDDKEQQTVRERRYAAAMRQVGETYPDDPTAWTLYADALMNLTPWRYWTHDGRPEAGTAEILDALERALQIDPDHIGANHYYIHAIEASSQPERGLQAAQRLDTLELDAGHLAHMPGHIYLRVGDYDALISSSERAVHADHEFYSAVGRLKGGYESYHAHNLEFLAVGHGIQGEYAAAMRAVDAFEHPIASIITRAPGVEHKYSRRISTLLRFEKWDELLALPEASDRQPIHGAFLQYGRGIAYAAKGDMRRAIAERRALSRAQDALPPGARIGQSTAQEILAIAAGILDGRIALVKRDIDAAVRSLRAAVALEDALAYDEPPNWHNPVRETLGSVLLDAGRAVEAELVFREDLQRNRRNPRSLFGLACSLKMQDKHESAALVWQQFERSWRGGAYLWAAQDTKRSWCGQQMMRSSAVQQRVTTW